jgi:hypothetical protein
MIDVFDDLGKFRSGRTVTNIWPFYKVDKRLACMSSYNGRGLYLFYLYFKEFNWTRILSNLFQEKI